MSGTTASDRSRYFFLTSLILIGAMLFVTLGVSLDSVWLRQFDRNVVFMTDTGPRAAMRFFEWVTVLGSDYVLGAAVLVTAFVLYRLGKWPELVTIIAIAAASKILEHGLKFAFHRTRPDLFGPTTNTLAGYSFPSGHSLNTAAIYGFILLLVGSNIKQPLLKYLVLILGVVTIVLVGISRVILDVHWPTDVLGGWLMGSVLVLVGTLLLSLLKKHVVEP